MTDGTYFVHEADGEIVACGGWSRRARQYAGDGDHAGDDRLLDPGTEPLYHAFGFEEIGRGVVTTPDGIDLASWR